MTVVDCRMNIKIIHCAIYHENIHKKSASSTKKKQKHLSLM